MASVHSERGHVCAKRMHASAARVSMFRVPGYPAMHVHIERVRGYLKRTPAQIYIPTRVSSVRGLVTVCASGHAFQVLRHVDASSALLWEGRTNPLLANSSNMDRSIHWAG